MNRLLGAVFLTYRIKDRLSGERGRNLNRPGYRFFWLSGKRRVGNLPIFYVVGIEQIGLQIFVDTLLSSTNISTKYGNFLEKNFFPAFFMW